MKRKIIASILGISLIASMAVFTMADDTTDSKPSPGVRGAAFSRNLISETVTEDNLNKIIDAMDLTDSEKENILEKYEKNQVILEKIKDLKSQLNDYFTDEMVEKAKELEILKDNKRNDNNGGNPGNGGFLKIDSEDELSSILDQLDLTDSEEEAILEIYESNQAIREKLDAIRDNDDLTKEEKQEQEKALRDEMTQLFTKNLLDKIKDLNLVKVEKEQ
jgi:hypothetical protein